MVPSPRRLPHSISWSRRDGQLVRAVPRYPLDYFETLTPREREVMALVVAGRLNKQIAYDIGISEITVKVHRSQVIRKIKVSSLPDLARMADKLNFTADGSQVC
jgi:FixJ family two-component response regulator